MPDIFEATADDFAVWATQASVVSQAGVSLAGASQPPAAGDPDEARLLLGLMRDYLGLEDPRQLGPGDLRTLLLDVYPRKVSVLDREDLAGTIPTTRGLLRFLAETGRAGSTAALAREIDEIEPHFTDAAMDPANWGMARSIFQEMASDGVDVGDQEEVGRWIAWHNARRQLGLVPDEGPSSPDGDPDQDAAIRDAFGLPDRLPALRLPDEAELASAARQSRLLAQVRALAEWAHGRELTQDGDLVQAELAAAARLLGIEVTADPASIDDLPELRQAWHLACCTYFIDNGGDRAETDEAVDDWPDGSDDAVLDVWAVAFGHLCGHSLPLDGLGDESAAELGLAAVAGGLVMALFLARSEGIPGSECRSLMNEFATADLSPARARKTLAAWTRAHGELADLLLGRLSEHGAAEIDRDSGVVRLTPLGMWQMRVELADTVEVPLLPSAAEMTAADLVAFGTEAPEDELAAEQRAWLAARPGLDAARELLRVAADGGPAERMIGTSLAVAVGQAAEPLWRDVIDDPALGVYAKVALNQIAGHDPAVDPLPGLQLGLDEMASILGDTLMAASDATDGAHLAEVVREAVPPGSEERMFELMCRSPNPAARQSLEVLGQHHPDKKIAKAARKAAFKARTRAGSPR
jgi:hypothetical protein